jgi:hypothetical protein
VNESLKIYLVSAALTSLVLQRISAANKAILEDNADLRGEALREERSVSDSKSSHMTIIIMTSSLESRTIV